MPTLKYRQDGETVREYTEAEYARDALDALETVAATEAAVAKAKARQVVLDRLGITADEAALILG